MNDKKQKDPGFIRVNITVTRNPDGTFHEKFHPEVISVTDSDTVLNFRLDSHTASEITIRSVSISPEAQDQLSHPSISKNGKHVTLSDVNSARGKFHLAFTYQDKKGQQIPRMAMAAMAKSQSDQYPEIENDPPPG